MEDNLISVCAAKNPKCPKEILAEILRRGNNDDVACSAASNPNCPPEALAEVLKNNIVDMVSCNASINPNCPIEILVEIVSRGRKDGVFINASRNPTYIKYLEKIKKENRIMENKIKEKRSRSDIYYGVEVGDN
jgi:hypothetical protein